MIFRNGNYLGTGDFIEDVFSDIDGGVIDDAEGDGVGGSGVDFQLFAVAVDVKGGEKGVFAEIVDDDFFEGATHLGDDAVEEVVGHGSRGGDFLEAAVDGDGFADADDDGESAIAAAFAEENKLLFGRFLNNDPNEFHFDIHVNLVSYSNGSLVCLRIPNSKG